MPKKIVITLNLTQEQFDFIAHSLADQIDFLESEIPYDNNLDNKEGYIDELAELEDLRKQLHKD